MEVMQQAIVDLQRTGSGLVKGLSKINLWSLVALSAQVEIAIIAAAEAADAVLDEVNATWEWKVRRTILKSPL